MGGGWTKTTPDQRCAAVVAVSAVLGALGGNLAPK